MNLQHFSAILWLRWRLSMNQLRKGGIANVVVLVIIFATVAIAGAGLFAGGLASGWLVLGQVSPFVLLLIWDGIAVAFLFFWLIGLMAELQRTEVFSLEKFLHLPVSLSGIFFMNYLGSLLRLSLIVFVPAMIGLSIGLVISRGPSMLWLFPLIAAFLLMVTALTYQFQGWLAALMSNPRRRRTIVVIATLIIILIAQVPNLVQLMISREREGRPVAPVSAQRQELKRQLDAKAIAPEQFQKRSADLTREEKEKRERENEEELQRIGHNAQLVSAVVPPGWLPLGVMAAGEGQFLIPLATTIGLALIGSASLWRAYHTTIRIYTGQYSAKPGVVAKPQPVEKKWDGRPGFIEKQLPFVSEQTAAVALAGFRSLLRAPEAKLLLLSPIILVVVFGTMLYTRGSTWSPKVNGFLPYAAVMMTLMSFVQLSGNLFGFDRGGYRVFVLSPASRRDIILGKNLAIAPYAIGICWLMTLLLAIFRRMYVSQVLAMIPQAISMYLVYCILANWLSIYSPMPIKAGSLKPMSPRFANILMQIGFVFVFPMALAPSMLPMVLELFMPSEGWASYIPLCLILSIVELVVVVFVYRLLLTTQGDLLQAREQAILEVVTKTE